MSLLDQVTDRALEIFWSAESDKDGRPMTEQTAIYQLIDEFGLPVPSLLGVLVPQTTTSLSDLSPDRRASLLEDVGRDSDWNELITDLIVALLEAEMNKRDPRCDAEANRRC